MNETQSVDLAKKYLEDILSFFGLNVAITAQASDNVIELKVPSTHLKGFLIGSRGETLRSLQYLVSTTLKNREATLYRVNIDIADYKAQRADRLVSQIATIIQAVRETGEEKALSPMSAADRRVVHQAVAEYPELITESEGEGRDRHIVIRKKAA